MALYNQVWFGAVAPMTNACWKAGLLKESLVCCGRACPALLGNKFSLIAELKDRIARKPQCVSPNSKSGFICCSYYKGIRQMVPVSDQDMNTHLAEISRVRINSVFLLWIGAEYSTNFLCHLFLTQQVGVLYVQTSNELFHKSLKYSCLP